MRLIALFLALNLALLAAETTPEQDREAGFAALRAAQSDPDKLVDAARALTRAAEGFEKAGNEAAAEEVNSALYWTKKKLTIQQMDAFLAKGNGVAKATVAKLEAVEKKEVKTEDSKDWLAKADAYAAKTTDQFLVAVRYFEVASRFKGTSEGETALDKSLKALQAAKVDSRAVAGKAEKGDGKVYVQSAPAGADILVKQNDELRDTGVKTPGLVQLPKGATTLVLRKDKFEDSEVKVVIGDAIVKPEPVKLEVPKYDVEVTTEAGEGWIVFVDGKLAIEKGCIVSSPCTIKLSDGAHVVGVVKEGFVDFKPIRVTINKAGMSVAFKDRAVQGQSALLTTTNLFVGKWTVTTTNRNAVIEYEFFADGRVTISNSSLPFNASGKTKKEKNGLSFACKTGGQRIELYTITNGKLHTEHYAAENGAPTGAPHFTGEGVRKP